jgi:MinD-like ATPase involved in chromosome partitioning or flagellar assembly
MVSIRSKNLSTINPRQPSTPMETTQTKNRLQSKTHTKHDKKKRRNHRLQMRMRLRIPTTTPHNPKSTQTHRGKTVFITIHSYKGGTGKSLIAANLATIFATSGKDVCLIDLDLRAPSLSTTFKNNKKYWINDYLNKICRIDQTLNDYTPKHTEGSLLVALANPNTQAIRDMSAKDRKWEMEALARIINLNSLFNKGPFDYVIIDSSPGLQYSSINAIIAADLVLMVTSTDISDLQGTQRMLTDLLDIFEKKTGIIVNKVPPKIFSGQNPLKLNTKHIPIIELIPCSCEILQSEGDYISINKNPDNPVTKALKKIANKTEQLNTPQNPEPEHTLTAQ